MTAEAGPVLVFGANGQVARELWRRRQRLAPGWPLIALGRAQADLSRPQAAAAAIAALRPALVINAAACTAVDEAERRPEPAFALNRDAPAAMAEACAAQGIALLHLSTDYVFAGDGDQPCAEPAPVAPLGIYGRSKAEGEAAIAARLARHVILRTAWVFSAHGHNFVRTMLRLAAERPELRVVDDQWGCPTPAAALADALLDIAAAILTDGAAGWGLFHFCGTPPTTWRRFAEAILAQAGPRLARTPPVRPIGTAEFPTPARRPAYSVLDCTRIRRVWGLSQPDWRTGLGNVLDELLSPSALGSPQ